MIKLTNIDEVKALQSNLRVSLDGPQGREVIRFLEQICGWYDFSEIESERILVAHGKRQVLAVIKTLLRLTPDQVVALAKEKEE